MKTRRSQRGLTLIEVILVAGLTGTLLAFFGTVLIGSFRLIYTQMHIVKTDSYGMQALRTIDTHMSPAILPMKITSKINRYDNKENLRVAFDDIDNDKYGFGGRMGSRWRSRLRNGLDSIAFVVPLDPVVSGDYIDGAQHVFIGQRRGDNCLLGASVTKTKDDENNDIFIMRTASATERVNILADMDPDRLNGAAFELNENPTDNDWNATLQAGAEQWEHAAFMAIRYIPATDGAGNIITVNESTVWRGRPYDLDGDGNTTGVFQVGKLQLLYSGGVFPTYNANSKNFNNVTWPQQAVDLTPNVVLRHNNVNNREPIFQVVDPNNNGRGTNMVRVRFLVVENTGFEQNKLHFDALNTTLNPRWFETTVTLLNMIR